MAKLQSGTIIYGTANVLANLTSGSVSILGSGNGIIFVDGTYQTTNAASFNFSTQGYLQANNAASFANGAFTQANNAASFANGAFTAANVSQAIDNTQNTNITSAQSFANGAFSVANSAASFANGAFSQANSAASFANGAFTTANTRLANTGTLITANGLSVFNFANTTGSTSLTTGAVTIAGGLGVGGTVYADIFRTINNGNGTNLSIGDDIWLGDVNQSNTLGLKGQQDSTQAYIVFGDTNKTTYIGRSGSGPIQISSNTAASTAFAIEGYANRGGVGYHDFLRVTSTYGSVTNGSKHFRLNSTGAIEIINSAYSQNILTLTDTGSLSLGTNGGDYIQFGDGTRQYTANSASGSSTDTQARATAQAAFDRANSGYAQANSAASFANGAFTQANSAASFANGAFTLANNTTGVDNTQNTNISSAQSFANGAFSAANSAASFANGSFITANSAASFANGAFARANSAYDYANTIAASSAQGAFDRANSAYAFANTGYTQANNAASFANSAFTKANNALANTTGTFAGDLTIAGNLFVNGTTTTVNTQTLLVGDNLVVLNSDIPTNVPAPSIDSGIEVNRGLYQNTQLVWSEVSNAWRMSDGNTFASIASANLTQAAFNQANNAFNVANVAYTQANNASSFANGAFEQANSAASFANGAFTLANNTTGVDNTQNTNISSAQSFANGAFTQANNATATAQGAYNQANNSVITLTSNSQTQITTNNTLGNIVFGLAATGVTAGSYAYYTNFQVDAFGRMTSTTASTILEPMGNAAYAFTNTSIYSITANTNGGLFANGTQGVTQTGNVLISVSNTHITNAVTANTTMGLQVTSLGVGTAPTVGTVTIGSGANTIVLTPTTTNSAGGIALNMDGNAVFRISKTVSSPSAANRIDLQVGGLANILAGPRWSGLHFTAANPIISNSITGFPRAFTFWEYDAATNPTYLNFNIVTGNSGGDSGGANSNMNLGTFEFGNVAIITNGTERMQVTRGGDVGIGGIPAVKLDVIGTSSSVPNTIRSFNSDTSGTSASALLAQNGTGTNVQLQTFGTDAILNVSSNNPLAFRTNNTERVRITTNGGVSFGASGTAFGTSGQVLTSAGDAPPTWNNNLNGLQANTSSGLIANGVNATTVTGTALLSLATSGVAAGTYGGTTQIPVFTVDSFGRATYAANVAFSGGATITDDTTTSATRYPLFADATSGTLSTVYTDSTGLTFNPSTSTLSAGVFTSLSDENQKTNIKPIQNALNIVENIKGVTFDWKESNLPSAGLLAQDVEKYLPQLIENVDDKKTLNYNGVIGILVEAIKELNEKVKQLENKK